jgi:thioredoxin reductase (NADPH)
LVVGGGDSAIEEATFLTKFASKVTVVHRRDSLRASKIMQERATSNPKIEFLWDTVLTEVLGDSKVTGAKTKNLKTGEEGEISAGGIFVAIGHTPNTSLFEGKLDLIEGYIRTQPGSTATSVEGVFASGDVVDYKYRQAITAAGMGCQAAIDAERWLESQHDS